MKIDRLIYIVVGVILFIVLVGLIIILVTGQDWDDKWYVYNSQLQIEHLAAGITTIIVLGFALWRSYWLQRQTETAERQADIAAQQADTAVQSHLNDRYKTGTELLGDSVLSVRIGGIYILSKLANERPELYHIHVMNLFCFTVRFPPHDKSEQDNKPETEDKTVKVREDIQEIMTIVSKRKKERIKEERDENYRLDLRGANLSEASLRKANLSEADLTLANLSGAKLKEANLSKALLIEAKLAKADLRKANLSEADLREAKLAKADLRKANLSEAYLEGTNLSGAKLSRANLSGAKLSEADLSGAELIAANLSEAVLFKANLSDANLRDANLSGADLEEAILSRTYLEKANLSAAELSKANLSGANLSGAFLFKANLSEADLSEADLRKANLSDVKGLTQDALNKAKAIADPSDLPILDGAIDPVTKHPLVWQKTEA